MENHFSYFSTPLHIVSDRGVSFTSYEFGEFTEKYGIQHIQIATSTPRANGQIERVNRDLTTMLSKLSLLINKWDKVLGAVEFAINNSVSRSTESFILLFGVSQNDFNDHIRNFFESQTN